MNHAQIYAIILFSFGAIALYMGYSALRPKYKEFIGNTLLGIMCMASFVWSFGFGIVFVQRDISIAYWGRAFGMIGVFAYLITVQLIISFMSKAPTLHKAFFIVYSLLGIPVYFMTVARNAALFLYDSEKGMTYVFTPGVANDIYSVYTVVYAVNVCISIGLLFKRAENRRQKSTAKKFFAAFVLILAGMVFDTIMPMFGTDAVPGSSISQFVGLVVLFYAMVDVNATRVTINNMSSYIYYSVSEPVLVFDIDGNLKLLNEGAGRIFPKAKLYIDGEKKRDIKGIFKIRNTFKIYDLFAVEEDYFDFETDTRIDSCISLEDKIPVELNTNRIRDRFKDPIGYIVVVKDMTEINSMMDALKKAKKEADDANLAKSVFLANMSHEIRTPLNAIVGFSELLIKEGLKDEQAEQAEDIRSSAQNLLAIINDILDISKIESGRMELVNDKYRLSEVIKDAGLITDTLTTKKGLKFEMDIDEKLPDSLFGDRVRVRGALVNVLNNAVKYTREGFVKLTGRLEAVIGDEALLRFEISDSGIGIKEEDIPNLFDSFAQVDKKINSGIEGTGLGLAIVKGYMELMNGSIEVKSEYGKGTTFILTMRQKIEDPSLTVGKLGIKTDAGKIASNIGDVKYTGVKVLSVDDSRINLKLVEKSLAKYGMDVTSVPGGLEAINKCKENEYDVILMDQMMPQMGGLVAMQEIRKLSEYYAKGGKCKIIALTANAISGVKEELIAAGFDNYLSKPMNFKEVESMFSEYFG